MTQIVTKRECAHCNTKGVAFVGNTDAAAKWTRNNALKGTCHYLDILFQCGVCGRGTIIRHLEERIFSRDNNAYDYEYKNTGVVFPTRVKRTAPPGTPQQAVVYFDQAINSFDNKSYDAAGAMLRKSLEVALKVTLTPSKSKLYDLIVQAGLEKKLTTEMVEWAQTVRIMGNSAAHDIDPWSREEAEELLEFVDLLFVYQFTLPMQTKKARDDSEAKKNAASPTD